MSDEVEPRVGMIIRVQAGIRTPLPMFNDSRCNCLACIYPSVNAKITRVYSKGKR